MFEYIYVFLWFVNNMKKTVMIQFFATAAMQQWYHFWRVFSPTFEQVNNVELLHFICSQPPSSIWLVTWFWGCCVNYRWYFHIFVCPCPRTQRVKLDLGSVMKYKPRFSPKMLSVTCFGVLFSCNRESLDLEVAARFFPLLWKTDSEETQNTTSQWQSNMNLFIVSLLAKFKHCTNPQYVTHQQECLLVRYGGVHCPCCRFSTFLAKAEYQFYTRNICSAVKYLSLV